MQEAIATIVIPFASTIALPVLSKWEIQLDKWEIQLDRRSQTTVNQPPFINGDRPSQSVTHTDD